jgi:hypothetical protein
MSHSGRRPSPWFRSWPTPELEKLFEAAARTACHMKWVRQFFAGSVGVWMAAQQYDLNVQIVQST